MRAERHARRPPAEWAGFPLPAPLPFDSEQMKETSERLRVNAEAMMGAFQKSCATAATIGAEWNAKVADAVRQNLAAGLDLASDLAAAKSLPEFIEVSTSHARRQVEATLAQNREFWSLGQKLLSEAAQPMTAEWSKSLGPEVSS